MHPTISTQTRTELLEALRQRYRRASKQEKAKILDEFVAVAGCHRKHAIRLLAGNHRAAPAAATVDRRIYDEAVREALVVLWEAADRICGKRLKAVLPRLVAALERHGHLTLDPTVRQRLHAASPATIDRLLAPERAKTEALVLEEKLSKALAAVNALRDFKMPADVSEDERRELHALWQGAVQAARKASTVK